ncbi:MAG TPA: thioredoxin domain-containing protein [Microscillaceae bacterium]|nr:thioredoxin domain-containing protein [Microscillaceae bacterium]
MRYSLWMLVLCLWTVACQSQSTNHSQKPTHTNRLINESSPYLLQHAHNPVNWYPWSKEALAKAKKEKKMIIVSIGYAACHWCHVMEKESFENEQVAKLMNQHFISIKIDREERPDIDKVYMSACQLLNERGCGWPLNVITMPDGKPIFAGTYFPKKNWINLLEKIQAVYEKEPNKMQEYAARLTNAVKDLEKIAGQSDALTYNQQHLTKLVNKWMTTIDFARGGRKGQMKFPSPVNYDFLLRYYYLTKDKKVRKAITTTLDHMAAGGIYDHLGGGFARYSTDPQWKVPHFEKMLYDNGQLLGLYAQAYQLSPNRQYRRVVYETFDFLTRELTSPVGGFYSSLDADSEGEEGKYYVWTKAEIDSVLGKDAAVFNEYFEIKSSGNWEHKKNILYTKIREEEPVKFAQKHGILPFVFRDKLKAMRNKLLEARSKRIRPGLDDKMLMAWNALTLKGLVQAYRAFDDKKFLKLALKNVDFLLKNMAKGNQLYRNYKLAKNPKSKTLKGKASINAFLDDYALLIDALIELYQATLEEKWLLKAKDFTEYALKHFYDAKSGMFFYTSKLDAPLIARKMDISDNVIPGSNSVMANNLFKLGHYFYNQSYLQKSRQMLHNVQKDVIKYGYYYANWASLMLYQIHPPYEVAIVGKKAHKLRKQWDKKYLPNALLMGGRREGNLPLLKNKWQKGKTMIYVCKDKVCKLPVTEVNEALKQLK